MSKYYQQSCTIVCLLLFLTLCQVGKGQMCSGDKPLFEDRVSKNPLQDQICVSFADCDGFVSSTQESCEDKCSDGQYAVLNDSKTNYICTDCSLDHVSSDQMSCIPLCLNEMTHELGKQCLPLGQGCQYQIKQDYTSCASNNCVAQQTPVGFNKLCTCDSSVPYYDMKTKSCMAACPSTQIVNSDYKVCLTSEADCYLSLSSDGKVCSKDCQANEISNKVPPNLYSTCSTCGGSLPISNQQKTKCIACDGLTIADMTTFQCIQVTACTGVVSSDGKRCDKACNLEEVKEQQNGYFKCKVCEFLSLDQLSCLATCPLLDKTVEGSTPCLKSYSACSKYVSGDSCVNSCPLGQVPVSKGSGITAHQLCSPCSDPTPLAQIIDGSTTCVAVCDKSKGLILFPSQKFCQVKEACENYLSSDGAQCSSTCLADECSLTGVTKYSTCSKDAPLGFFTYTKNSQKYCVKTCPETMIPSPFDLVCLTTKSDCKTVISSDQKSCLPTCDKGNLETAVQNSGFKLCTKCQDLYLESDSTCITTCPTNFVAVYPTFKCVAKGEASVAACKSYKMASDEKSCDTICKYPDSFQDDVCTAQICTKEGICSACPDGYIQNDLTSETICQKTACTNGKLSSDGKKCVADCNILSELNPILNTSNACVKCEEPKVFMINNTSSIGECLDKSSVTDESKQASIEKLLDNVDILNQRVLNDVETTLDDYFSSVGTSINANKDNAQILDNLETLADRFLNNISSVKQSSHEPHQIGSKTSLMTSVQRVKDGRQSKPSFSLSKMLSEDSYDLTQVTTDGTTNKYDHIITSVIVKNPACKSDNCKNYPIFQAKTSMFTRRRRILTDTTGMKVEFTVTEASQLYICQNYDLAKNTVKSGFTVPTINGLTVICPVNGSTSLFLDSTCIFLDKSKCEGSSSNQENDDDGLSAGGILGIVIGSVAFAAILGAGSFFLYKRHLKKQSESKGAKYIQTAGVTDH